VVFADPFSVPSAHSKPNAWTNAAVYKDCKFLTVCLLDVTAGTISLVIARRHKLSRLRSIAIILLHSTEWLNFINERMYLLRRTNGAVITCNSGSFLSPQGYSPFGHWSMAKASPKEQHFLRDSRYFMVYELVGRHSPMRICALDRDTAWRHGYTPTTRYRRYLWWYFLVHRLRRQNDVCLLGSFSP